MKTIIDRGIQVLIPRDAGKRKTARPGWDGGLYSFMRARPGHQRRRPALRQARA